MLRGTREQGHRPPAAAAVPRVRRAGEGGGVDHVGVMLGPQTSNTRLRAVNTQDQKLLALMVKRVGVALRPSTEQRRRALGEWTETVHALGD